MKSLSELRDTMNNTTFSVPVYPLLIMIVAMMCLGVLIGMSAPAWLSVILLVTLIISNLIIILVKSKHILNKQGN